nr:hypothetical protein [Tanacetum cinerariifolium]
AMGLKKKTVVVTSDPLALIAEKTKVNKSKEKVIVSSDFEGSGADDFSELKKITALLAKDFNRRKFYSKPTNNNLKTSSTSQSANKKQEFVKSDDKKDCKKAKVKDYNYYKIKMLLAKKDSDEQVLLAEDQAWMESSSDSDQEITANMVFMAQILESEYETSEYYDNTNTYGLFVNHNDDQENFHECENFLENLIESQIDHNESVIDHNDSKGIDKLIRKFNKKIVKCQKRIEKANQQSKDFKNQNKDLQDKYNVLKNQATTFEMNNKELNEQLKVLIEKNDDLLAQIKAERYEYMIRYSAYFDNDKQHRKQIADQEVLYNKMSIQLVALDKRVRDLKNTVLEKDFKIFELEECVPNKDLEIKMSQTNQTVYMIMPSKDILYNGRKRIGFKNPRSFEKAKDLRPSLYDEKVLSLGYTPMFLTHSDEALEIEKFKRARENKIEFAYDYGSLNASYVNEKINFPDDYFQEIINSDFEKIDSPFQQTSSLKPYVPNVILEKIIIDLEDEVVSLLEKEKENLKTIESLKSKGFESSENEISELENQTEIECFMVEKECDKVENPKVITPRMFKLSVSQSVSPISMSKTSCDSNNVENCPDLSLDHRFGMFKAYDRRVSMGEGVKMAGKFVKGHCLVSWRFKGLAKQAPGIVQICLWIIDSGCSKHLTGNRALLTNFVEKFLGTVRFGNNAFAVIAGYGDVVIGSLTIKKVYYQRLLLRNLGCGKMKFEKDHLCSACEQGKIHRKHHKSKTAFALNKHLFLLHMDLCGLIRVQSINGKRYVLVVVDDYSRYTWVFLLHSKDEASEFKNKTLAKFFDEVGITQQFSAARTPQQNGVVERRNRNLVEAIMKSSTTNVETSINEEVFHEVSELFQAESSLSSLNDDVQLTEALKDADWVSAMQDELNQFARLKV